MNTFEEKKIKMEYGTYASDYWNGLKKRNEGTYSSLAVGLNSSGFYLLPLSSDKAYREARKAASVFRKIATSVSAYDNDYNLFAVDGRETVTWVPEGESIPIDDCVNDFTRYAISSYKLATILRLHDDTLADSQFNLEDYLVKRLARNFGKAEDDAFINGDGDEMPTGILNSTGGAEVGITTSELTFDDVIGLYFSLDPDYRERGAWIMNDTTALALRTMKDNSGNYLWNAANDTILGKPVYISNAMPDIEAGEKPIAFGDFSYYWIVDRESACVRCLRERFAIYQQTGYLATEFLDAKLIRPDAVKVLQIAADEEA